MRRFVTCSMIALALVATPALAQNVKVYDPSTGLPVFSATNPASVKSVATGAAADQVQGTSASGAVDDASNPVKIGVLNASALGSGTAGLRANALGYAGAPMAFLTGNSGAAPVDTATTITMPGHGSNFAAASSLGVTPTYWNGAALITARGDVNGAYVVNSPTAAATSGTAGNATAAAASALVVKASAGNLYGLNVTSGAAAGFVMIFNAVSAPADGAVTPARCIPLAASTGIELNYRALPMAFTTGITVVFSTTGCFSKTASATAFIAADAK